MPQSYLCSKKERRQLGEMDELWKCKHDFVTVGEAVTVLF